MWLIHVKNIKSICGPVSVSEDLYKINVSSMAVICTLKFTTCICSYIRPLDQLFYDEKLGGPEDEAIIYCAICTLN